MTGEDGIGFMDFEQNEFWSQAPSINSIGAVAAKKEIEGQTLIALLIRGGGYRREWGSNFQLGGSGEHLGFSIARDEALEFLSQYIRDYDISGPIKLWLVGYSRGGAVANITAGALNMGHDLGNGAKVSPQDLYCYTFEAPQGTMLSIAREERDSHPGASNIHNILNVNDLVPLVAMSYWDFARFGEDHYLFNISSGDYPSALKEMEAEYKNIIDNSGVPVITNQENTVNHVPDYARTVSIDVDPFFIFDGGTFIDIEMVDDKSLSNAILMNSFVNDIASTGFDLRTNYVGVAEDTLVSLLADLMGGKETDDYRILLADLSDKLMADDFAGVIDIIAPFFSISTMSFEERVELSGERFAQIFINALESSGMASKISDIVKLIEGLGKVFVAMTRTIASQNIRFIQFLDNLLWEYNFLQAHYAEMTLAWVRVMARRNADFSEMPQIVRVIRINCPVDVEVVEVDKGHSVARIRSEKPVTIDAAVFCAINENDEKIIQVPGDRHYNVKMRATVDGKLNYHVSEYHLSSGKPILTQNYYDMDIAAGDEYVGDIPEIPEDMYGEAGHQGTSVRYTLTGPDGEVPIHSRSSGDNVRYYDVNIRCNNLCGIAYGGGRFVDGSFAKLTAKPVVGGSFEGWYVDGKCVWTEPEYRFAVNKDSSVTAKFKEVPLYDVKFSSSGNGAVKNIDIKCAAGTQVALSAIPDEGARFLRWETTSVQAIISDVKDPNAILTVPPNHIQVTAVFSGAPISIETQPEDQYVVEGQRAKFAVVATGDGLSYQWLINRNDGKGWVAVDGATGAEYLTSVVDLSNDGYQYKCVIRDSKGNVAESTIAVLHVNAPSDIPETGDTSKPMLWLLMLAVGMAGILYGRKSFLTR